MTSIIDEFPNVFGTKPKQVAMRLGVVLCAWVLGIPMVTQGGQHLLFLVDEAVLGFPLLFIGLFEYIVIIHIYGYRNFANDIKSMLGFSPFIYFHVTWRFVSPLFGIAVIVFKAYQMEDFTPAWSGLIYYLIIVFCLSWIPGWYLYYTLKEGVWKMMRPQADWISRRNLGQHGVPIMQTVEDGVVLTPATVNGSDKGYSNSGFDGGDIGQQMKNEKLTSF
jgi:hypothetical protein